MPYREVTRRDWCRLGGCALLTVAVIVVTAAILIPLAWPVGLIVWLAMFVSGSLFLLVRWHAKVTAYRCPACGYEFEISVLTDFASLQVPDKKYLKCPRCGKRDWATVLMKKDER
jgi:DNA-directed RNA polymerase subunit RPC12/RpoP